MQFFATAKLLKGAIAFSEERFYLRWVPNIEVLTIPLVEDCLKVGGDGSGPLLCRG